MTPGSHAAHPAAPAAKAIPTSFADLGLSPAALGSLEAAGYTAPTPVQAQAIPPALRGLDVIGCAATGTGKTAAFVLPIIERLAGKRGTRALVLAPTRELVIQIAEHLERFGRVRGVRGVEIVGGLGMEPQVRGLREGREVVIATPGRLIDHLERGTARLDGIEILILDEADRMLDMGFKPQLDRILARLPRQRQTMLFSATMASEVAAFARSCLREPVRIEIVKSGTVATRVEQRVYHVQGASKGDLLLSLLNEDDASTLVFTRTKHRADRVAKTLFKSGHSVARIHGDRSQSQRQQALDSFKAGRVRVLVATDIAARGIDVEEIGHVVNFDLSRVPEDHVHRVGRTARAAKSGRASSFCSPEERGLLTAIERFTRTQIPRVELPYDMGAPRPAAQHAPAPRREPHPAADARPEAVAPDSGLVPVEVEQRARPSHGFAPRRRSIPWHLRQGGRGRSHSPGPRSR
jgi:ATP-dependent RNA helicase RhlE